ncbi:amidohydrolase family protein [Nocardioidaceae bacterium]|nr:amidohydrolase family protein [Nocardioidaceae bacterium]
MAADSSPTRRTLLRGGVVHTGRHDERHTALAIEGDRLVGSGDDAWASAYDGADEVVELAGAWVAPAFVDAHVHTVATGFLRTQLDLIGLPSLEACLRAVAEHDERQRREDPDRSGDVLLGTGWDETAWPERRAPTGVELDRAAPGRPVYVARVDGHSAVVSARFAEQVPDVRSLPGWHDSGLVEREAYAAVNAALGTLVGPGQRLEAARAAVAAMAAAGIAGFHENAAPHLGPAEEMSLVRRAAEERGLHATLYWGARDAFDVMDAYGAVGLAGDLNADGAIGSCTAAMSTPYTALPDHSHGDGHGEASTHRGHEFLSVDEVAAHVLACTSRGVQAGFHCIGDAALEVVAAGFESAARTVGDEALRACRHRLEHVEMPSARVRATMARLGVVASVQPVFDALWGGPHGMYADRLGERWREMNPFAAMHGAGVPLALGSDGPVTPVGPWEATRAAVAHRTPGHGIDAATAFAAHTLGGWRAARVDDAGRLAPGWRAHLAAWRVREEPTDSGWLPGTLTSSSSTTSVPVPTCESLWVNGRRVDRHDPK